MMVNRYIVGYVLVLGSMSTAQAKNLCQTNETESFSCHIKSKTVSVCIAPNKQLIYRYGKSNKVELELKSDVHFSSAAYSGGGEGRLTFDNKPYQYIVYSGMADGDWLDKEIGLREKLEFAGVYVFKNKELLTNLKCTSYDDKNYIHSLPPHELEEFYYF
ncbi:TPA: hypothetical protein ACX6RR_002564 [Photobacterium damselae]